MNHQAELVPIESLKPYRGNPRTHNLDAIRESLRVNSQYRPVVVRSKTREVLAGNGTMEAARAEGWSELWATFVDVDARTAKRIVLADNRTNDLAGYDDGALAALLGSLPALEGTGYSDEDLRALLPPETSGDTEPGEVPVEPVTRPGDLWLLGEHRLLCGDAFSDLDRIYADIKVGCVLTDPPYGIGLDTDYSPMESRRTKPLGNGHSGTYRPVIGDERPFDAKVIAARFAKVREQFWFGADHYRRTLSADDRDGSWLVWDKRNEASDAGYGSGFELIWSKQRHKRDLLRFYFFAAFGVEGANRIHPTQKPTPLLGEILTRWVPEGCIVADPFAGSGSTLIACENLGRRCYAMEIDPAYCDVILDRYRRHTGKEPQRAKVEVLA